MVVVPADAPAIRPVLVLIVAAGSRLAHVPPVVVLVRVVLPPMHIDAGPAIVGSAGVTVTVVVRAQPAAFT